jgi:branched-chain amino acid aminotransferase
MIDTIQIDIQKIVQSRIQEADLNNIVFGKIYSDHMFMAKFNGNGWNDYRIVPYQNLSLSPGTAVLHYGQSIFEGLKAYRSDSGEILVFRPYDNLHRMNVSAERMVIPAIPEEVFMGGLNELIRLDSRWVPSAAGTALYIRPFVFATDEYIGIRPSDGYQFIIFTCPVGAYYSRPVKVKIETEFVRSVKGGTGYAKAAGNYAASLYPAIKAQREGYDQLIWTDGQEHRFIEESGTMNVMFVIDDVLITAPAGDTILKGITRDSVLTLARDWGFEVQERPITVDELVIAIESGKVQEAFGTGTAATIAHIETIGCNGKNYHLPSIESREFSQRVLQTLDDIKYGRIEDKYGWIYRLKP